VKVWIDLANSPHAPLFAPIARVLEAQGHEVVFTARDHAQTLELAHLQGIAFETVGGWSPAAPGAKARAITERALALRRFARTVSPDVALSHNSYAQIVAARTLGIRAVTAMDFEHQPSNHVAFRLADTILLPEAIAPGDVRRQGAVARKLRFYPGFKEDIYLGDFTPDANILEKLAIEREPDTAVVVTRTPPSGALYHPRHNNLYAEALRTLGGQNHVRCIVLTRHPDERAALLELALPNLTVPERAVDARSLMYAADLVVGGGGTMTREAARLGVPTASVFAGRRPAVDRALERNGALHRLENVGEIAHVAPRMSPPTSVEVLHARSEAGIEAFTAAIAAGK
jgi:predicted glycosyltransferase